MSGEADQMWCMSRPDVRRAIEELEKAFSAGHKISVSMRALIKEGPPDVDEKGQRWQHWDDTGGRTITIEIEPC